MTDESKKPATKVSMSKPSGSGGAGTKPDGAPGVDVPRPRSVLLAVGAMVLAALAGIGAAGALFGEKSWLADQQRTANAKSVAKAVSDAVKNVKPGPHRQALARQAREKAQNGLASVPHAVSQAQTGALIQAVIVAAILAFLAFSAYRGRHWTRWGVLGFWLLASLTGSTVGVSGVLSIGSGSVPIAYKVPAAAASLLTIAAIVLVALRPSLEFFAAHKPVSSPDAPVRRGLFAPRTPPSSRRTAGSDTAQTSAPAKAKTALTSSAASRGEAYVERQRAKKRAAANAESIARGAELARSRAKASKSRRIETR